MKQITLFWVIALLSLNSFSQKTKDKGKSSSFKPLNIQTIESVTGMKGKEQNGEYKITVPQNDLKVEVDGFKIIPAMGLGAWAAFTPSKDGAMVMGDMILTENDLKPVQQECICILVAQEQQNRWLQK